MSSNYIRQKSAYSGTHFAHEAVLTIDQLNRISKHRYNANGTSILEPYMQHFWKWLVEQIPLWWAPNAITLVGLVCVTSTSSVLMLYSPDGISQCPQWCFLLCAMGLFLYQSLDAIDGKQARRTNTSSPLGELFDHGCDAVSMAFASIAGCVALGLGSWPTAMFFICFAGVFLYYCAHWQTFCSGCLQFGRFDVTETLFAGIFVHSVTGLYGQSLWYKELPLMGLELRVIPVSVSVIVAFVTFFGYLRVVLAGGVGKNGSTVAGTSVLSPGIPIVMLILMALYTQSYSEVQIFERHPVLFTISFGFAGSKLSIRLVLSHMSRTPMCLMDSALIGPLVLVANLFFGIGFDEYTIVWFCFIFCSIDLLRYSIGVCRAICDYLNIYCFRISVVPSAVQAEPRRKQSPPVTMRDMTFVTSPASVPFFRR